MIVTLVLVAVLALFTFVGAKKGLVRSVVSLLGSVAAFFLARFIAGWVTPMIAGQVPLPGIGTSLTSALNRAEL
ncbi:MAG: CvpA family protein, partial [Clostridia bacterium]|nr:CvpA family protein [Clostridia bacterium]